MFHAISFFENEFNIGADFLKSQKAKPLRSVCGKLIPVKPTIADMYGEETDEEAEEDKPAKEIRQKVQNGSKKSGLTKKSKFQLTAEQARIAHHKLSTKEQDIIKIIAFAGKVNVHNNLKNSQCICNNC